jgi:hypothetical protein
VTDFGIAKALEEEPGLDLTSANTVIGTAKYLAPEQIQGGPIDPRTDLFALGLVLYEAVAGRPPWQGDTDLATALGRLTAEPVPIGELQPGLDPELDRIINRAIARRPEDRFQSATELRLALETLARNNAHHQQPTPLAAPIPGHNGRQTATGAAAPENTAQLDEPTAILHGHQARRAPRRWPRMAAAAIGVATLLAGLAAWAGRDGDPQDDDATEQAGTGSTTGGDQTGRGEALSGITAYSYDPFADNEENDYLLGFALDGQRGADTADVWRSDCYFQDPLPKAGFGLILEAPGSGNLAAVELITRNAGWRAEVYVSEAGASSLRTQPLESWGPIRARIDADTPTVSASLGDIEGRSVLVFFTSLADVPLQPCFSEGPTYRVDVIEAALYGGS